MRAQAEPTFRTEKYRWLKEQLEVDLIDLDDDVSKMPVLLQECGESAAIANEIRDSAKEEFDRAKAECANELRTTIAPGGKAPSESSIESRIPLFPQFQTKQDALAIARLDAALWQSLMSALQSKSYSIGNATSLIGVGFITQDFVREKRRAQIRNVTRREQVPS